MSYGLTRILSRIRNDVRGLCMCKNFCPTCRYYNLCRADIALEEEHLKHVKQNTATRRYLNGKKSD